MISKTAQNLVEKVFEKSGLGKWFNKESAGGGPGWDRYNTKVNVLESVATLMRAMLMLHV